DARSRGARRQGRSMTVTNRAVVGMMLAISVTLPALTGSGAQLPSSGQNIQPVFEGWERNQDGSFNLVFGYFNRNSDEEIYVPIGPANHVTPDGPAAGAPRSFYPIRNMFVFRVRVPNDFGTKEVVWTVSHRGRTDT